MQVVSPLYAQRENTQNFLEKLPETKQVLDTLTDTLESPEVKELLGTFILLIMSNIDMC